MYFESNENNPILVCIPGLLGGPEDFNKMIESLSKKFTLFIVDPNQNRRSEEGINLSLKSMEEFSYDYVSEMVKEMLLTQFPDRKYYFLGISFGGKVVYDFASKFPDFFSGGVVTDVSPGPFNDSDLFKFINETVENIDLNQTWSELKKTIQTLISDKNLRILIQTQISYPNKNPPAVWKTGIGNFEKLLNRQSFEKQVIKFLETDTVLMQKQSFVNVVRSDRLSSISSKMYEEMKKMKSIKIHEVIKASHFLHITHFDLIIEITLSMLNPIPTE